MSTQFTNRQWRLPNNENKDKQSNYSMDFDGSSNQEISLGTISQISSGSDFSISLWFKSKHSGGYNTIFGSGTASTNDIYIAIDESKNIEIGVRGQRLIDVATIVNDIWYHFVLTVEGTTYKAYLDNGTPATGSTGTNTANSGDNAVLGDFSWTGNYHFNGQIDAVSIFNYALSASQITTLYGSSSTGIGNPMSLSPAPVAYYPLGDQDAFNGADYLVPNSSLKDYVFNFDGSNDYIDCGNDSSLTPTNGISISLWVKTNDSTSYASLIDKWINNNTGYMVHLGTGANQGKPMFQIGANSISSSVNIRDNNWHHVAVTCNNTTGYIYVDGVQTGTGSLNMAGISSLDNLKIGGDGLSGPYITASISNVQIFNSALPATGSNSVETLYNNGSPLTSMSGFSSLQGWWKLDASATYDGTNWSIPDDSSNSNDGTSSGMTQANLVQSDLSFTSGYSPYALNFDGANDYIEIPSTTDFAFGTGGFTISLWVNFDALTSGGYNILDFRTSGSGTTVGSLWINSTNGLRWYVNGGYLSANIPAASFLNNTWYNVIILNNGSTTSFYLNGTSIGSASDTTSYTAAPLTIGDYSGGGYVVNGSISNVSVWNAGLTSSQVTEIYSEGVPQNLNNHSAYSNLVSWWQLGSNSSFNTNWTVLDEKGSNNGTSVNMIESDIVDGVNSYANGLSSGMGGDEVIGDAPYSSSNSLSVNMDVEDRTTDTPS